MSIFSSSLEISLENAKMTQHELAERSGLTPAAISQYISGQREPQLNAILQICHALKLTPNDLLGFHSEKQIRIREENAMLRRKIEQAIGILEID